MFFYAAIVLCASTRQNGIKKHHRLCAMALVGLSRLELPTSRLSGACSNQLSYNPVILVVVWSGGDERNRTADPLLAKQVLSQLSYTPEDSKRLNIITFREFAVNRFQQFNEFFWQVILLQKQTPAKFPRGRVVGLY